MLHTCTRCIPWIKWAAQGAVALALAHARVWGAYLHKMHTLSKMDCRRCSRRSTRRSCPPQAQEHSVEKKHVFDHLWSSFLIIFSWFNLISALGNDLPHDLSSSFLIIFSSYFSRSSWFNLISTLGNDLPHDDISVQLHRQPRGLCSLNFIPGDT